MNESWNVLQRQHFTSFLKSFQNTSLEKSERTPAFPEAVFLLAFSLLTIHFCSWQFPSNDVLRLYNETLSQKMKTTCFLDLLWGTVIFCCLFFTLTAFRNQLNLFVVKNACMFCPSNSSSELWIILSSLPREISFSDVCDVV